MNLGFSQEINGKPSFFLEKIWSGLVHNLKVDLHEHELITRHYQQKFGKKWDGEGLTLHSKIHTIRQDQTDKWHEGNAIHFIINSRTHNRFQFAPILRVQNIQYIHIRWDEGRPNLAIKNQDNNTYSFYYFKNKKGIAYGAERMLELALNDGFESIEDFFKFFNEDFTGKLIHWTEKIYNTDFIGKY